MENQSKYINKYDEVFLKIFEAENQSVGRFFDAIFGFFSRTYPELIFDSSKHYGKQLLESSYEKWQSKQKPSNSAKRVKNDYSNASKEREECWNEAPNPGGPTHTTYTATVSKMKGDGGDTMLITKSKNEGKQKILNFDTTNGANLEKYFWTQTADDVDIRIPVGACVSKGNQVKVHIEKKHLRVEIQNIISSEFETVVEGELLHAVRLDDCVWLLSPRQHIAILLEKLEEQWWNRCLLQESPIDMKKIIAERDYHSLPEEDKKTIEKVISDKHKEERGEPTSDQVKMESILRKAWNAEGSPFKDQPFDPSVIKVMNSS